MANLAVTIGYVIIESTPKVVRRTKYLMQDTTYSASVFGNTVTATARKVKYGAQNATDTCAVDAGFQKWLQNGGVSPRTESIGQKPVTDVTKPSVNVSSASKKRNNKYFDNPTADSIKIPIKQIQDAELVIDDWCNTGWKLHLPVQPDVNNSLTREICEFLNKKWGLDISKRVTRSGQPTNARTFFQDGSDGIARYKVGECNDTTNGKGMTIYGISGTKEEIFQLADEIEKLFGTRIATSGCPIYHKEMHITPHVSARFVDKAEILTRPKRYDYCEHVNKNVQGITIGKNYGTCVSSLDNLDTSHWPSYVIGNKALENEFLAGDSVLETIRDYGEMFTGKIVDGKIPKFILESFSPEYLKYHPNLVQELSQVVKEGNLRYIKAMLKNIVSDRLSPISRKRLPILDGNRGKIEYLTQMDKKLVEQAKKELSLENPEFLSIFNQNIEAEISNYPELSKLL